MGLTRQAIERYLRERLGREVSLTDVRPLGAALRASDLAPPGIYAAARTRGAPVPGMGVPYEAPERPELTVDTARIPVEVAAAQVCHLARRLEAAPARRDAA